jgi:hypothetical protein
LVQATAVFHVPLVLQVCWAVRPEHCVCPWAQTPAQAVPTQVWLVQATAVFHVPLALQVCSAVRPEHWV